MCTVDDLKEMGIPLGPRKKLAKFVKEKAAKQVNAVVCKTGAVCLFLGLMQLFKPRLSL